MDHGQLPLRPHRLQFRRDRRSERHGSRSTWTNGSDLYVGYSGSGTLNVSGGATVTGTTTANEVGYNSGSTGKVTVTGTGSKWTSSGPFLVGDYGSGMMNITGGGTVNSNNNGGFSYIGYNHGSAGVVTVDGSGSTWTNSGSLIFGSGSLLVGYDGSGTLNITGGGTVSISIDKAGSGGGPQGSYIGYNSDSTGKVTVDGIGSTWTNSGGLTVGYAGNGVLNITGGGAVTATSVSIDSQSLLMIDVDNGSKLSGPVTNNGTFRIVAGAGGQNNSILCPSPLAATAMGPTKCWAAYGTIAPSFSPPPTSNRASRVSAYH